MGRVLVTGGAGFIGSHLCLRLAEEGHKVHILDDLSNGLESNLALMPHDVEVEIGSILDVDRLSKCAKECDAIFHLAAISNVQQTKDDPLYAHAVNGTGTLNILQAARENGSKVIYSSSAAVYGDTPEDPKKESGTVEPISLYGSQKLLGEHYASNYADLFGVSTTCLRYFNVFGPRQRPDSPYSGVISVFLRNSLTGQPITIFGTGEQTRDFVSVHDVVEANVRAMGSREGFSVLNVCRGKPISVLDLSQSVGAVSGQQLETRFEEARPGDILRSCGDPSLAKSTIGFEAQVSLKDGLAEIVALGG